MIEMVLDASALIAVLRLEPGADKVSPLISKSCISAVNLSETLGKMIGYEKPLDGVAHQIRRLRIDVIPFDTELAAIAASFWKPTRQYGLSLGDRACLALAAKLRLPAYTTEGDWQKCKLGVTIVKIR